MSNYTNIGQKLEEFRSQFEASRKNFKTIANELKPMLFQNSELDSRISENNRIIDTFLTSIKNTSLFKNFQFYILCHKNNINDFFLIS